MLRHPHFTQPIFVRFPRPAILSGREGVERFPPAKELPFADAVARQLRQLDGSLKADEVKEWIAGRPERDVRRALLVTRRERPADVRSYFRKVLGRPIEAEIARLRPAVAPIVTSADPYA
jgi:hypothetical protein